MINSIEEFTKSGFIGIAYVGDEVTAVFNKLDAKSANEKTGSMVQSWIIANGDVPPHKLVKARLDSVNCGSCILRAGNGCYVRTYQAPHAVWKANQNNRYAVVGTDISFYAALAILNGKVIRFGSYGNPSAAKNVPWSTIAANAKRNTGYDHEWKTENLQDCLMASVHGIDEKAEAKKRGYRTFRTIADVNELDTDEILCPASEEAGRKTTCDKCGLCSGNRSNGKNIAIVAHGSSKKRAIAAGEQAITFNLGIAA